MKFLEKDLEEIIYDTYLEDRSKLSSRGLYVYGEIKRQLKIGNYGVADLVTFERHRDISYDPVGLNESKNTYECLGYIEPILTVTVYELKKDKIGISAYLQAIRYVKGLKTYFEKRKFTNRLDFNIVLIGSSLDLSGSFSYIPSLNDNVSFYTYNYDVDGIKFDNENNYQLTHNGFKI